jgi:Putative Ig domain
MAGSASHALVERARFVRSTGWRRGSTTRVRTLVPAIMAFTAMFLVGGQALPAAAASAGAASPAVQPDAVSTHARPSPSGGCDVAAPPTQLINFPVYADTDQEICGVDSVEDDAYAMYAEIHGYPVSDPRVVQTGSTQIAGMTESMLEDLADVESGDISAMSTDDQGAYDWLEAVDNTFEVDSAQDALNEYNKWNSQQCNYLPPNTTLFTYNPADQSVCQPGSSSAFGTLLQGLAPPTYAEFQTYGIYEADEQLGVSHVLSGAPDEEVIEGGITEGMGAAAAIIGGAAPTIFNQLEVGQTSLVNFLNSVAPSAKKTLSRTQEKQQGRMLRSQQNRVAQKEEQLDEADDPPDEELVNLDEGDGIDLTDAGMESLGTIDDAAAEAGADALGGALGIVAIGVTIAVTEGINVITAAEIPGQLQADLTTAQNTAASQEVENLISDPTGAGYLVNVQDFENQLNLPGITTTSAPPTPPAGTAEQFDVTALYPNGTPSSWQWYGPTVSNIDTWPMGVDDGTYGPPEETIGVSNGVAWAEQDPGSAATDATADGLSGYLPSGEIDYFDAAGHPQIAYIDNGQFATLTSPGSIDSGGADLGDNCATNDECTLSNSIVVMGLGGTAQLQDHVGAQSVLGQTCEEVDVVETDCLSDTLLPDGSLVPSGGTTSLTQSGSIHQNGTSQLFRLTLEPDTGTPAGTEFINQYGNYANDQRDGAPDGGLVAGQTVSMDDPLSSPFGYSTTYTWQIETKCPYNSTPPSEEDGLTVCANDPDYHSINGLPADQQDLTTCLNPDGCPTAIGGPTDDWQEDPDFHGDPVATITGQSIQWTWPAPGTYNVRLVTTDQYGITNVSNEDVSVTAASSPGISSFSFAAASGTQPSLVDPTVIGPVENGDALSITGCLSSPDFSGASAYSTPAVSVNWGDGSTADTGTAGSSSDPNLTFTFAPGSPCSSPWEFTATHTYSDVSSGAAQFIQKPITISTSDVTIPATPTDMVPVTSFPTSNTYTLYANIYPSHAAPTFVNGSTDTADFTAGVASTFTGFTTGDPIDTISDTAASGVTENGAACTAGLPPGFGSQIVNEGNNTFTVGGDTGAANDGCYAITVTATDTYGTATQTLIINVEDAPAITGGTSASAGLSTGSPGSVSFTSTGFPTGTWSIGGTSCSLRSSEIDAHDRSLRAESQPAPRARSHCAASLPAGFSFTDNGNGTATLSNGGGDIPASDAGTYTFAVSISNSLGTSSQAFTLTIGGKPIFTSNGTAGFFTCAGDGNCGGQTFNITTGGYPATTSIACSYEGSACPSGSVLGFDDSVPDSCFGLIFTDNGNGTATISGCADTTNSYTLTLTATNAVGSSIQTLTLYASNTGGPQLTIVDSPPVAQYSAPVGEFPASAEAVFPVGTPNTVTVCSADPDDTLYISSGTLPAGLTLTNDAGSGCPVGDESATVSGTPTTAPSSGGNGVFNDELADGGGGLAGLEIFLTGSPSITSPSTATFTEGQSGTFTIAQETVPSEDTFGCFSAGSLPQGLNFVDNGNNTATISGTPTSTGQSQVTVTASDCGSNSTSQALTIDVIQPPQFTSAAAAGFSVGAGGTFTVTTNADAYPVPTLSDSGSLPAGVTFHDNGNGTGTLSVSVSAPATPTAADIDLNADSSAGSATEDLVISIGSAPTFTTPSISPSNVTFTLGTNASYTFATTGAPVSTFTCSIASTPCSAGNLPAGLTFTDNDNGTATLSGTPTATGVTALNVSASNGIGSADVTLSVNVDTAPAFTGTTTAGTCATPSISATSATFVVNTSSTWTLCASGTPTPALSLVSVTCAASTVALPPGLTFTDNGDGSATISGTADPGSGVACPSGYTLDLDMANGSTTATQLLTLVIKEVIVPTSTDTTTFVAGGPNSYTMTASATPTPSFADDTSTPLPTWLTLTDNGNGTATLLGTPPTDAAGTTVNLTVDETNGSANPLDEPLTLTVAPVALTAASPPDPDIGEPYSYTFTASAPATFSVAPGSSLPAGLTLSAAGVLSGTPTEMGRFPFALQVTSGATTVSTSSINLVVGVGNNALEITQFRSFGPSGMSDWFVQLYNNTSATLPLTGWDLGVQPLATSTATLLPIGTGTLAPGATTVVSGPSYSLNTQLPTSAVGPGLLALPGGFEVVAPNGSVVDVAGETGAPDSLYAGTAASYPTTVDVFQQDAFVRTGFASGSPVDTDDNAADFTYGPAVVPATPSAAPTPPAPPAGSTSSASGTSTTLGGTASADNDDTTASATGVGALTVAQYSSDPVSAPTFSSAGEYFDVALSAGNSFSSTTIDDCNLNGGQGFEWFNPAADGGTGAWQPVEPKPISTSGPPACLSVTLNAQSSPTLAQLTGTVIGVTSGPTPSTLTQTSPTGVTVAPGAGYTGQLMVSGATGSVTYTETPSADSGDVVVTSTGAISAPNTLSGGSYAVSGTDSDNSGDSGTWTFTLTVSPATTGPPPSGYWDVASDGGVFSFGEGFYGSTGALHLNKPIVGMAPTPDGKGYWLVASDGGIFAYGDATFEGSMGGKPLNKPIVGMAATPDGKGYWLVASDGGIFSFGDARFYGSTGSLHLNKPIVGMAATSDGKGYWLVASDGGIFSFGDASFYGSTGALHLNKPIVGMAATPDDKGYWLVASDGGIFSFGDATFYGSESGLQFTSGVVGMASTPDGKGYWLVASNGDVSAFGNATSFAPLSGSPLNKPIVGIATG